MIVGNPVAQTRDNHVAHIGVVAVQRIATATEVEVSTIGRKHVIGLVVDTAIGDIWASLVTFSCVVEHHIEHHLNAIGMQAFHKVLQFVHLHREPSR